MLGTVQGAQAATVKLAFCIPRSLTRSCRFSSIPHQFPLSLCFSLYVKTTTTSLPSAVSGLPASPSQCPFPAVFCHLGLSPVLSLTTESIRASDIEQSFLHYYSSSTSAAILFPFPGIAGVCATLPPPPASTSVSFLALPELRHVVEPLLCTTVSAVLCTLLSLAACKVDILHLSRAWAGFPRSRP